MATKLTRREKGMGSVYQSKTGGWIGRLSNGKDAHGKRLFIYFSGHTEAEVKRKIRDYLRVGSPLEKKTVTVSE